MQTKYLGRQWRKSNMKTMSAIYAKVRHRLNDDWAYGNGEKERKNNVMLICAQIWQKRRSRSCVIPRCYLHRGITQPILRLFEHICTYLRGKALT